MTNPFTQRGVVLDPRTLPGADRMLGNLMLGVLAGAVMWALGGSLFGFYFRDDLSLLGHPSVRAASYVDYGDAPY